MKRILLLLLCILIVFGCAPKEQSNVYHHALFTVSLPEHFEAVKNAPILCFAPYGDPLLSSSITVYTTELNPYFDEFSDAEYESALKELCGYEELKLKHTDVCRIDGYRAVRLSCSVQIEQGTHQLIIYAVNADCTYFFSLLNREGDPYIDAFDTMMNSLQFTKK